MNKPARIVPAEQTDFRARFTTAEFVRMIDSGIFADMKIELVEGELARMNPPMNSHAKRQLDIGADLRQIFRADRAVAVMTEIGIALPSDTVLVADVAVARTELDERRFLRPQEMLLVVEIAETTLVRDMGAKRIDYARGGIPHYWVVDTERRVVHVYGEPIDGDYASISTNRFGEPIPVPGTEETITLD